MEKNPATLCRVAIGISVVALIVSLTAYHAAKRSLWSAHQGVSRDMGGRMMKHSMDMDDAMSGMMSGLAGKTGTQFDQAFLKEMIMHHEGAVVMAKEVLIKSERSELKNMADDIIKAQTAEIEQMKKWQTEWAVK